MSYSRTRPGERGYVTELYAREAMQRPNGYSRVAGPTTSRTSSQFATVMSPVATRKVATTTATPAVSSSVRTRPGYVWVPAAGGIPAHWERAKNTDRPAATGTRTPPMTEANKAWCRANGFTGGLELRTCMDHYARGRRNPDEIRDKLKELAAQAFCRAKGITGGVQLTLCMREHMRGSRAGTWGDPGAAGRSGNPTMTSPEGRGAVTLPGEVIPGAGGGGAPPGGGVIDTTGGGGGGGSSWRDSMETWGGGAELPSEMAPLPRPPVRAVKPFPTTLAAAGIAGGAVLLYLFLKRKK